jgi:ABC-type bacteriocin/lantibiotic exporter with double-glycine peptidase domain
MTFLIYWFSTAVFCQVPAAEASQAQQPYEVIKPDAAWCGPRVLFFLLRLHGLDTTLESVVKRVDPDPEGYCPLEALERTARQQGLSVAPLHCDLGKIISINRPAILCFRKAFINTKASEGQALVDRRWHFIAFVGAESPDKCWILDTSRDMSLSVIPRDRLEAAYLNTALVCDMTTGDWVYHIWLDYILWSLLALAVLLMLVVTFRKMRSRARCVAI